MEQPEISEPATAVVAVIGLGVIGGAVVRNLLAADVDVVVYDLREPVVAELAAQGALRARSAADAARGADVVILAVVDDAQVLGVVTGDGGVLSAMRPGSVIVIHSTVRVATVREVEAAAGPVGVHVLDAGVSTGAAEESGKLAIFVGGDASALAGVRPVLDAYSHDLEHVGGLGSGMAAKLVRNLLSYSFMAAAFDALRLAEAAGVDLEVLRRILDESNVIAQAEMVLGFPTTRPVDESADALAFAEQLTGLSGSDLDAVLESSAAIIGKDIDNALALAEDVDVRIVTADAARRLHRPFLLLPDRAHETS